MTSQKRCSKCKKLQDLNNFYPYTTPHGKIRLASWCKQCKVEQVKELRRKNREGLTDGRKLKSWFPKFGSQHHKAKLSDEDVRIIRSLHGIRTSDLCEKFEVSKQTIQRIRNGSIWTHI
jgi:hypothetical protein